MASQRELQAHADAVAKLRQLSGRLAERAGLIRQAGRSLVFWHPLIRAAVCQGAPLGQPP